MFRTVAARALVALWLGLLAYCLLAFSAGPGGLSASDRTRERMAAMRANLEALKAANAELSAELDSLRSDPDRARREARSLGYLAKGEVAIVIPGAPKRDEGRPEPGSILEAPLPATLSDLDIKATALIIALGYLVAAAVRSGGEPSRRSSLRPPVQADRGRGRRTDKSAA